MLEEYNGYLSREQVLIGKIQAKLANHYLGDDCARLPGNLLVSTDTLVEGTHFLTKLVSPEAIGWKAMAVNLSDIAAMAGKPRYALVAITVPKDFSVRQFDRLYQGIIDCAHAYRTQIVGGDITSGQMLSLTITVIGECYESGYLGRAGAQLGDIVIVSGDFGSSAAGLFLLLAKNSLAENQAEMREKTAASYCLNKHNCPLPRLEAAWQLAEYTKGRGALMDASDGLADALAQILRASQAALDSNLANVSQASACQLGMKINLEDIPICAETRQIAQAYQEDPLNWALYGGEDYELVATLSPANWRRLKADAKWQQLFVAIGEVTAAGSIELMVDNKAGPPLDLSKCFQHIK